MQTTNDPKTPVEQAQDGWFYATKPTAMTVLMRTFIPWQLFRFAVINWKMVGMIRRSHAGQKH
jgi:hypothetical protein